MLDAKIEHLHREALPKLGPWLARTFAVTENKAMDNEEVLSQIGITEEILRKEWANQISAQTKPLPSKSFIC
jgi:hypothetical protein